MIARPDGTGACRYRDTGSLTEAAMGWRTEPITARPPQTGRLASPCLLVGPQLHLLDVMPLHRLDYGILVRFGQTVQLRIEAFLLNAMLFSKSPVCR